MLAALGFDSLDDLVDRRRARPRSARDARARPAGRRDRGRGRSPSCARSPPRNTVAEPMIGLGYHGTVTPPVIRRNVLENPAWYTAYTPYQPEICQGRLEALLNFQTMVADLTGLPIADASMLDEATAAAEAMTLLRRAGAKARPPVFVVDADTLPQTLACCAPGPSRWASSWSSPTSPTALPDGDAASACCCPYPGASGRGARPARAGRGGARSAARWSPSPPTCSRSPCSTPPGELGADVAVGTTQRFGVPLGFGGPHAGYLAVRAGSSASCPAGWSACRVDADGAPALPAGAADPRAAHPPGEGDQQHLHRAGAARRRWPRCTPSTTAPTGCAAIARRVHRLRRRARRRAARRRASRSCDGRSSTPSWRGCRAGPTRSSPRRASAGVNLRRVDADTVGIACDETTDRRAPRGGAGRRSACRRRRRARRRRRPTRCRRGCCARRALPDPPGVHTRTTPRPRCCATCAGSSDRTSRWTAR